MHPTTLPLSSAHELIYRKCSHWNFRRFEECRTLIHWLEPRTGERILDIGCGDGFWTRQIAASGAELVGIDMSVRGLEIARQRNLMPNIGYHFMDAEQISFGDADFDKIISFCVIEHFKDEDRVLGHVSRLLKPGGMLVLSADSLSNQEVTDAERAAHRERYAVNTFYDLDLMTKKLARVGIDVETHRYILTTPLTLAIVRMTWKLDDLPPRLEWLGDAAYRVLNTVGKLVSGVSEKIAGRKDSGLTLLIRARKRA